MLFFHLPLHFGEKFPYFPLDLLLGLLSIEGAQLPRAPSWLQARFAEIKSFPFFVVKLSSTSLTDTVSLSIAVAVNLLAFMR